MTKMIEKMIPVNFISNISDKEANSKKPIYQIHKWFARRTDAEFRSMLLACALDEIKSKDLEGTFKTKYYSDNHDLLKGKIILDPFMGGGTTLVNALRMGAKVIGVDINPVAWFITKNELQMPESNVISTLLKDDDNIYKNGIDELKNEFNKLESTVGKQIKKIYSTKCENCGKDADIMYVFWRRKVKCPNCNSNISVMRNYLLTEVSSKVKGDYKYYSCPKCREIIKAKKDAKEIKCSKCGFTFDDIYGNYIKGNIVCDKCGYKSNYLNDIVKKQEEPAELEMYAIEYYCPTCREKFLKKADIEDLNNFNTIAKKVYSDFSDLILPNTKILNGDKTNELISHNYRYWYDMFNYRQLYCLSILINAIKNIQDKTIKELFTLLLSNSINANNMFCKYNTEANKLEPLFGDHHMAPIMNPVENNVWGTEYGRGTFSKMFKVLIDGKKYNLCPYERLYWIDENGNTKKKNKLLSQEKVIAKYCDSYSDLVNEKGNCILKNTTSEDLSFIPSNSIEAVITDPPYYDAINYGEIAEFFYVWQRLLLKDDYESFSSEHIPNGREIIVNNTRNLGKEDFIKRLSNVFKEVNRVLKDDGVLAFTYHHKEKEGWSTVLEALIKSEFRITETYPVISEVSTGLVDNNRSKMNYDLIIVAKPFRDKIDRRISWSKFMDEVSLKMGELYDYVKEQDLNLNDILTMAVGKSFEVYSDYYPNITKDGNKVEVDDALDAIYDYAKEYYTRVQSKFLPSNRDEITEFYYFNLAGNNTISTDEILKSSMNSNINIDLLQDDDYIKPQINRSIFDIIDGNGRYNHIINKQKNGKELSMIDRLIVFYVAYQKKDILDKLFDDYYIDGLDVLANAMFRKTGDKIYKELEEKLSILKKHVQGTIL